MLGLLLRKRQRSRVLLSQLLRLQMPCFILSELRPFAENAVLGIPADDWQGGAPQRTRMCMRKRTKKFQRRAAMYALLEALCSSTMLAYSALVRKKK